MPPSSLSQVPSCMTGDVGTKSAPSHPLHESLSNQWPQLGTAAPVSIKGGNMTGQSRETLANQWPKLGASNPPSVVGPVSLSAAIGRPPPSIPSSQRQDQPPSVAKPTTATFAQKVAGQVPPSSRSHVGAGQDSSTRTLASLSASSVCDGGKVPTTTVSRVPPGFFNDNAFNGMLNGSNVHLPHKSTYLWLQHQQQQLQQQQHLIANSNKPVVSLALTGNSGSGGANTSFVPFNRQEMFAGQQHRQHEVLAASQFGLHTAGDNFPAHQQEQQQHVLTGSSSNGLHNWMGLLKENRNQSSSSSSASQLNAAALPFTSQRLDQNGLFPSAIVSTEKVTPLSSLQPQQQANMRRVAVNQLMQEIIAASGGAQNLPPQLPCLGPTAPPPPPPPLPPLHFQKPPPLQPTAQQQPQQHSDNAMNSSDGGNGEGSNSCNSNNNNSSSNPQLATTTTNAPGVDWQTSRPGDAGTRIQTERPTSSIDWCYLDT